LCGFSTRVTRVHSPVFGGAPAAAAAEAAAAAAAAEVEMEVVVLLAGSRDGKPAAAGFPSAAQNLSVEAHPSLSISTVTRLAPSLEMAAWVIKVGEGGSVSARVTMFMSRTARECI